MVESGVKAGSIVVRVGAASVGGVMAAVFGPEGGAAATEALAQLGEGAIGWIDNRRSARVAQTLADTGDQIAARLKAGEVVRADLSEGADGAALFEAVITAAAESAEDRKCQILANLYASLAFDPDASAGDALLFVRRIRDASWRQLIALQYPADETRREGRDLAAAAGPEGDARASGTLTAEMVELAEALGLAGIGQEGGSVTIPSGTWGGGGFDTSDLAKWVPTELGHLILGLGRVGEVAMSADWMKSSRTSRGEGKARGTCQSTQRLSSGELSAAPPFSRCWGRYSGSGTFGATSVPMFCEGLLGWSRHVGPTSLVTSFATLWSGFDLPVLVAGLPARPAESYIEATAAARAFASHTAVDTGSELPGGYIPVILTTHRGHFLGRAPSHLRVWRHEGETWIRDVGAWDRLAPYLAATYEGAGRAASASSGDRRRPSAACSPNSSAGAQAGR